MKGIRKTFGFFYSALFAFSLSACSSTQTSAGPMAGDRANPAKSTAASTQKASLLFVIFAKKAQVVEVNAKTRRLTLDHPKVVYFTDRPIRDVGKMSVNQFMKMWYENGKESFKADHPNAFVVAHTKEGKMRSFAVVMVHPRIEGNTLTFDSMLLEAKKFKLDYLTDVSIFVDGVNCGESVCRTPVPIWYNP